MGSGHLQVTWFQPLLEVKSFILKAGGSARGGGGVRGGPGGQGTGANPLLREEGQGATSRRGAGAGRQGWGVGGRDCGGCGGGAGPGGGGHCRSTSPTNLQMSRASSSGSSKAAKWPPRAI